MRSANEVPTLLSNFAVKRTTANSESSYAVRRFPRLGAIRRGGGGEDRQPNIKVPRPDMEKTLTLFQQSAEKTGLEIGQHDPAVKLLRVTGIGFGDSRENPNMHPAEALMQINDGTGNSLRFRLINQGSFTDGEGRVWDGRVVAFVEQAKIHGQNIDLTHEMTHEGFVFLTKGMPDILQQVKNGDQPTATIRQETPDAVCFIDGHHTFIGRHDMGCYCKEEREASLAVIHATGGVSSLMPGTGNGNGRRAQDMQIAARYSLAENDSSLELLPSYPEVYNRMGKKGDDRNRTLKISTLLLEHLFQIKNVPNITTLTESKAKQNVWNEFGAQHMVTGQSLHVTPVDHPDSRYKQQVLGYSRADEVPFPLQRR